eukprot:GILK01009848.1.p1 GENE.GILK01009848.1~~GILK01009848.1.p1  ORF type:complete len:462 (+),score=43.04 GILK01009848.1:587-1972(+)
MSYRRPLTSEEKALVCHAVGKYKRLFETNFLDKKKKLPAAEAVALLLGLNRATVFRIIKERKTEGRPLGPRKPGKKASQPLVPIQGPDGLSYNTTVQTVAMYMRDIIQQLHNAGTKVTVERVRRALNDMYGVGWKSERTVRKYLSKCGFSYKTLDRKEVLRESNSVKARVGPFIRARLQNSRARKDSRMPVVWTDESYIHEDAMSKKGWQSPGMTVRGKKSDGRLHAIIGAAVTGLDVGNGWLKRTCKVWKTSLKTGDYHGAMNNTLYKKWFENELLPSLPSRPCQIVMDNASYHKFDSQRPPISRMKKAELKDEAARVGLQALDGMSAAELRRRIKNYRAANPSIPDIVALAQSKGHTVVFTPPYMPEFQACELAWSVVKSHAIASYGNGKTVTQRVLDGFDRVDGNMWTKLAAHVAKFETQHERAMVNDVDESLVVYLNDGNDSGDESVDGETDNESQG